MSEQLPDGTIIPSFLNSKEPQGPKAPSAFSDTTLRVGRVVAGYEISAKSNRGKRSLEYDVSVRHAEQNGGYTDIIYPRVKISNMFGGTTDYFRWTPRIDSFDEKNQIGNGSRVLLLCINGNQGLAYIIGGIPNPEDKSPTLPFSEHHLEFQFNGVYANIDKEGQFTLIHRGSTNNKNEVKDSSGGNGSIRFTKEGDIELGFNFSYPKDSNGIIQNTDNHPYLRLVKGSDEIQYYAPGSVLTTTKQRFVINTEDGVKVNPIGTSQQAWLRATEYRKQQSKMHRDMQNAVGQVSAYIQQAGTNMDLAGVKAQVASKAIIVPIAGAVASAVPFTAMALAISEVAMSLSSAKTALDDLKQAISAFESFDEQYLSQKHFHAEDNEDLGEALVPGEG